MSTKPRIGFLGPAPYTNGSTVAVRFAAHLIGRADGAEHCEMRGFDSHQDVIDAKARGDIDYGIIAVENTLDSLITESIREVERLFEQDLETRPHVCWEDLLPIRHLLMHQTGDLRTVAKISSHPSALRQCSRFLMAVRKAFPNIEVIQAKSTGAAVEDALNNPEVAALGPQTALDAAGNRLKEVDLTAAIHTMGLEWEDPTWVTDFRNGLTRFWVLGKEPMPRSSHRFTSKDRDRAGHIIETQEHPWQKTCFLLNLPNKRGTLFDALRIFAKNDTSLAVIYPYPRLTRSFEYMFFVEVEGHYEDLNIQAAVAELNKGRTHEPERERPCMLFGSYPNTTLLHAFSDQRDAFRREYYPSDMVWRD